MPSTSESICKDAQSRSRSLQANVLSRKLPSSRGCCKLPAAQPAARAPRLDVSQEADSLLAPDGALPSPFVSTGTQQRDLLRLPDRPFDEERPDSAPQSSPPPAADAQQPEAEPEAAVSAASEPDAPRSPSPEPQPAEQQQQQQVQQRSKRLAPQLLRQVQGNEAQQRQQAAAGRRRPSTTASRLAEDAPPEDEDAARLRSCYYMSRRAGEKRHICLPLHVARCCCHNCQIVIMPKLIIGPHAVGNLTMSAARLATCR